MIPDKSVFLKQFISHLENKKGSVLTLQEKEKAEELAEKAWNFSTQNQGVLDGN